MSKSLSLLASLGAHSAVFAVLAYMTTSTIRSDAATFGIQVGGGHASGVYMRTCAPQQADEIASDAPHSPKMEPAPEPAVAWERFDVPLPDAESGAHPKASRAVELRPVRPRDALQHLTSEPATRRATSVASEGGPSGTAGDAYATDLSNPAPAYPAIARRRGYEGVVVIEFTVTPEGWATQPRVDASSGHACLDEAALDALRSWRFNPAMRDARPIASTQRVRFVFKLQ